MKKKLMAVFLVVGILVSCFAPATIAKAAPPETDVTGVITDSGSPVSGAMVTVVCGSKTMTDTTDSFGTYLVTFAKADCPPGSIVKVTATKGSKTGSKTGRVVGVTTKLNIALVNVDIPEYGWLGGLLAAGTGAGAIFYTRRRYAHGRTL